MRRVQPKVFLVGQSRVDESALQAYLDHIGTKWSPRLEAGSHSEALVEVYGRLCYRSWEPGMNANVTKVRTDRHEYIGNILASGHGSVIEHPVSHWIFADVSRVFTHELVRHRVGTAFSQESLRYVRLTDLGLWLPPEIEADPEIVKLFEATFESLEQLQLTLADKLGLDRKAEERTVKVTIDGKPVELSAYRHVGKPMTFDTKKKLTSAMRRVAPIGLATTIGVTLNMRALRHLITMRSDGAAEAEMKLVFGRVGEIAVSHWPSIFQDFERVDDSWVPKHKKV